MPDAQLIERDEITARGLEHDRREKMLAVGLKRSGVSIFSHRRSIPALDTAGRGT